MTDNSQHPGYAFIQRRVFDLDIRQLQSGKKKYLVVAKDNTKFRVLLVLGSLLPNLQTMFNGNIKVLKETLECVLINADVEFFDENGNKVAAKDKKSFVHQYVKNRVNPQEAKRKRKEEEEKKAAAYPKSRVEEVASMPRLCGNPGPAPQYHRRRGFYGHQQSVPHQSQSQQVDSYYDPMDLYYNTQHLLHSSASMSVFHPMQQQMYHPQQHMQQHMHPPHQGNNHIYPPHQQHMHPPHQGQSWSQVQNIAMGSNVIDQGPRQRLPNLEPQVLQDNDWEPLGGELLDALSISMSNGSVASGSILSIDPLGSGLSIDESFASVHTFVSSGAGSLGEAHHHMEIDMEG